MKNIKVLGSGCSKCKTTINHINDRAVALGVEVELEKIEDIQDIIRYGVMSTPGVVLDGTVVHTGGVPSNALIDEWLQQ